MKWWRPSFGYGEGWRRSEGLHPSPSSPPPELLPWPRCSGTASSAGRGYGRASPGTGAASPPLAPVHRSPSWASLWWSSASAIFGARGGREGWEKRSQLQWLRVRAFPWTTNSSVGTKEGSYLPRGDSFLLKYLGLINLKMEVGTWSEERKGGIDSLLSRN